MGFGEVVQTLHDQLNEGKVYFITSGKVKQADPNFNSTNSDVEITFNHKTNIEVAKDDGSIKGVQYQYRQFSEIEDMKIGSFADFLGVVDHIYNPNTVGNKSEEEVKLRRMDLIDKSLKKVEFTIWGKEVNDYPIERFGIISVKSAKIGYFREEKNISTNSDSILLYNPQTDEASALKNWYIQKNSPSITKRISLTNFDGSFCSLSQIDEKGLGKDKSDYFTCTVYYMDIVTTKKLFYPACPNKDCQYKGLITTDNINYTCNKCRRQTLEPVFRFNFSVKLTDSTGSVFANVIGDETIGKLFTQMEIQDIVNLSSDSNFTDLLRYKLHEGFFRCFQVKLRAAVEDFQSEKRVGLTVISASLPNYAEESKRLFASLKNFGN